VFEQHGGLTFPVDTRPRTKEAGWSFY